MNSSDDESMMSGGASTRPENEDVLVPESPAAGEAPSVLQLQPPETPPTPRSTQSELDTETQGNNNNNQQQDEPDLEPAAFLGTNNEAHIRGTDVHVPTAAAAFTDFLRSFVSLRASRKANRNSDDSDEDDDDDDDSLLSHSDDEAEPLYMSKLQRLLDLETEGTASLEIDTIHLYYHSEACQRLYFQLVQFPMEMIPLMDILVQRELERLVQSDEVPLPRIQVRPFNLKTVSNLRELDPVSMDSLVSCKGMIVRSSSIIPDLKVAHFGCTICGNTETVTIDRGRIAEPTNRCSTCNTLAWQLVHNRCVFADKQLVRLQETPDEVPAGQAPASVVTFCFDDLVDQVQPGKSL